MAPVGVIPLWIVLLLAVGLVLLAVTLGSRGRAVGWAQSPAGWASGAIGLAFLVLTVLVMTRAMGPIGVLIGLGIGCLAFWFREFTILMQQPDEAFLGRNDKLIWALLMILVPPVGLLAFWSYRRAHGAQAEKPEPITGLRDLS